MLDFWFELPVTAMFAVLTAVYGLIGIVIHVITFRSPLRNTSLSLAGMAPPLFGVVGLLFGLLTGFLGADVGDRNGRAARAVSAEVNALYEVHTLSIASASDMKSIRDALRDYIQSELADEWPQMDVRGRSAITEAAFGDLLREVADPHIAQEAGAAVHNALLGAVSRIGRARSERLAISADATNTVKWITVLLLGMITQAAIGLVHVERARAQITALTLFTCAVVVALGLMAMQEWPFSGPLQVRATPLEDFLKIMASGR